MLYVQEEKFYLETFICITTWRVPLLLAVVCFEASSFARVPRCSVLELTSVGEARNGGD
jgi:hypothetical protein